MRLILFIAAVGVAFVVNIGTFIITAGRLGDGYWTVGDAGLYTLSLFVAGGIVYATHRLLYD